MISYWLMRDSSSVMFAWLMWIRSKWCRCTALHTFLRVCTLCRLIVHNATVDHSQIVFLWVKVAWQRCLIYVVEMQSCHYTTWKNWPRITLTYSQNRVKAITSQVRIEIISVIIDAHKIIVLYRQSQTIKIITIAC